MMTTPVSRRRRRTPVLNLLSPYLLNPNFPIHLGSNVVGLSPGDIQISQ
jgi:hypothetical protein